MADNYDDYTKEELIKLLRERDRKPRFGLVWERKEIEHERAINHDFVALDLNPALSCGNAPFQNLMIEGDDLSEEQLQRALNMILATYPKLIHNANKSCMAKFKEVYDAVELPKQITASESVNRARLNSYGIIARRFE